MPNIVTVDSYKPQRKDRVKYAAVGQQPRDEEGRQNLPFVGPTGDLARDYLRGGGLNPDMMFLGHVYPHVLKRDEKPTSTEVKHGIERVKAELVEFPNLKAVVLFGSFAAKMAFKLLGGITRVHGSVGKLELPDGRRIDCLAVVHPGYVQTQRTPRQKQQWDADVRTVMARIRYLDHELELPDIVWTVGARTDIGSGMIGLDTETASQTGKRPDGRYDPHLITGLSDGRILPEIPFIDTDAEPIAWNLPFDSGVTGTWDANWHDGKMMAHLTGEADTSMKGCATRHLGRPMMEYDEELRVKAAGKIAQGIGVEDDDVFRFSAYCVQDAIAHKETFEALWRKADEGVRGLYTRVEHPMLRLYCKWTATGVFRLDKEAAIKKRDVVDARIREMRQELLAATGVDSVNKHAQLAAAIGVPSTEAKYIKGIWGKLRKKQKDTLVLVKTLRSAERQVSTYLDAWLAWDDPLLSTIWRPTAAWTGRPGSADFNLQNVPGPCGNCKLCIAEREELCALNLKPLLLAPEDKVLLEGDNSQAELRVAAHNSQDPAMLQAFREGLVIDGERTYDLHLWAQKTLGIPSRRDAKIAVLATFYGSGSAPEEIMTQLRATFGGYTRWANKVKHFSIVPGLFGRKMYVPPHPNASYREREAVNCPSQGGAVDVLKIQCNAVERAGFDTRHAIHDSCLVAVDEKEATRDTMENFREVMEGAVKLSVPMRVGVGVWPKH